MKIAYCLSSLLAACALALDMEGWQDQSIYQVMVDRFARDDKLNQAPCGLRTHCGGTWKGLIRQLDYIQGMGFTAVWISPIVKNIGFNTSFGEPYHGYWAQDITSLNSHFGTEQDLLDLSAEIHTRGMYLMLDVVVNHMSPVGSNNATFRYADYTPFNSSKYYHPPCDIDYSNQTSILVCWPGSLSDGSALADLRTEDTAVRDIWKKWIKKTVKDYDIDGLRIDSLKHIEKDFYPDFIKASGVFAMGELLDGDASGYPSWLDYVDGMLNYPLYFWINRAFQSRESTMEELVKGIKTLQGLMKTSRLGTFMESHDQKRFGNLIGDMALAKNAIAFTMLMDGIPVIYQGQEQHFSGGNDPDNRQGLWSSGYRTEAELYGWFALLNKIRSFAIEQDQAFVPFQASPIWSDNHTVAMKKAQLVSVLTNIGTGPKSYNISLPSSGTGYSAGQEIVDLLAPGCTRYTTASNGSLAFEMTSAPKAFYPAARLGSSDLCCSSGKSGPLTGSSVDLPVGLSTNTPSKSKCDPNQIAPSPVCYVTFNQTRTTSFGDAIKILGNIPQLGDWDANQALVLDASYYTNTSSTWVLTVALEPGTEIEYTFLEVDGAAVVTWEGGSIKDVLHTYTVPDSCIGLTESVHHIWEDVVLRKRSYAKGQSPFRVARFPYVYG